MKNLPHGIYISDFCFLSPCWQMQMGKMSCGMLPTSTEFEGIQVLSPFFFPYFPCTCMQEVSLQPQNSLGQLFPYCAPSLPAGLVTDGGAELLLRSSARKSGFAPAT